MKLSGNVPLEMLPIPGGKFLMGSPDTEKDRSSDETQHQVDLTKGYYMGKYEVTQAQWLAVMGAPAPSECTAVGTGPNYPVYCVSWEDISGSGGFLEKLNQYLTSTGQPGAGKYRLPTEAEWERAARGGRTTRFSFGDALSCDIQCGACAEADPYVWWCANNSPFGAKQVGLKLPNPYGLYDVHGNVWEWTNDWYGAYPSGGVTDPTGPATGTLRALRFGRWNDYLYICRSAQRFGYSAKSRFNVLGFRLARSP